MKIQRKSFPFTFALIFTVLCGCASSFAQAGGVYDLSHSVMASGGEKSANAIYKVEATIGQPVAGAVSTGTNAATNAQYSAHGGFWTFDALLAPTAASVSIGGRVVNQQGGNVSRVRIRLLDASNGTEQTALTNAFGHYRFDNIEIGRIYIVRAESKIFTFAPGTHVFQLAEAREDLDFTAAEPANLSAPDSKDYSINKNQ